MQPVRVITHKSNIFSTHLEKAEHIRAESLQCISARHRPLLQYIEIRSTTDHGDAHTIILEVDFNPEYFGIIELYQTRASSVFNQTNFKTTSIL